MHGAAAASQVGRHARFKPLLLVFLMLTSTFVSLIPAPLASAASVNLGITLGVSPVEGGNYSKYDAVAISVNIQNNGPQAMSAVRSVRWYVCAGDYSDIGCPNDDRVGGLGTINNLEPGEEATLEFSSKFFPDESETGIHTVEFKFVEEDNQPLDDVLRYNFWVADFLFDVQVDQDHDPRPADILYAMENDQYIYNSGVAYPMYVTGISYNCFDCIFDVEMGWKLFNSTGSEVASNTTIISDFSVWGQSNFNRTLPDMISPETGVFTLEVGVFSSNATDSSGANSEDLNSFNDLFQTTVIFNDSVDLTVESMFPAYQFDSPDYFYGNDSVRVDVSNNGYIMVEGAVLQLELFVFNGQNEISNCTLPALYPRQTHFCTFNLNVIGEYDLNATLGLTINGVLDINPHDNWISENGIEVVAGALVPSVVLGSTVDPIYDTGDTIEFIAQVSSTAAKPLNYTWWLAGIIPKGEGRILNLPATELGMGDWSMHVQVIDALGNQATASKFVTIYNRTSLEALPVVSGEALTRTPAALDHSIELPRLNINYNLPENLSPLMLFEFDVVSTDADNPDPGLDGMEFDLNFSSIIPDSVPDDSLVMYSLNSMNNGQWHELVSPNSFLVNNNTSSTLQLSNHMILLLAGVLPPITVSAEHVEVELLPGGYTKINFEPTGDLDNVYFNGWKILKRINSNNIPLRHPSEATMEQEIEYEELYYMETIGAHNSTWFDPVPMDDGFCASYAILPIDRQGIADWENANISGWDGSGLPQMVCGDAIPPNSGVSAFSGSSSFTNDTDCFNFHHDWDMCYVVNLTWSWPEEEFSFHLFRAEVEPNATLNLTYLEPIATNLSGVAGETGWWNESSSEGILPHHSYYYFLTPVDEVGNVNLIPNEVSGSYIQVKVTESFWDYNQHIIPIPPPPEEPPYGVEYLGELEGWLSDSRFQTIGIATLVAFCINLIALPLILKQRKVLKLKIGSKTKWGDDEEIDDDLASFFS
jgi:hypothetical protein